MEQGRVRRVRERFKRNADLLKPHEAAFKSGRREVVGVENLALDNRKIDLDLVEPAGVKRV